MILKYIIIPKTKLKESNQFLNKYNDNMDSFTVKLFKNGIHSHYFCTFNMTDIQYEDIKKQFTNLYDSLNEALEDLEINNIDPNENEG